MSVTKQRGGQRVVSVVAYRGDRSERRGVCRVLPWNRLKDFDWAGNTDRS